MERRFLLAAFGLAALASCAPRGAGRTVLGSGPWRSTRQTGHPLAGAIWSTAEHRQVDGQVLERALRSARYRLLGEVHDNPDHHRIQLELLSSIAEAGRMPTLAFEQFDREHDDALQEYMESGKATTDGVADAVRFDRKGWNWNFYRPLVEFALRHALVLRAANLSPAVARNVVKDGLASSGTEHLAALRLESVWSAAREKRLREVIAEGHCGALPERILPGMIAAQRARDSTLAQALLDAGPDGAVLIAGNGHVRRDLGVPLYLPAARGASCAVGILEVEEGKEEPRDYYGNGTELLPQFDFVCFTPGWERPDPCASFKPRGTP